jgi:phage-related minor tail protein
MGFSLQNFIASAAGAGGDIMANERQNEQSLQRQKDMAVFSDDLAAKRAETVEALRVKRESANQQRLADQADQVDKVAADGRNSRNLSGIIATQAGIAGSAPNASAEEMQAMLNDPKNRKIYEDAGYIPRAGASDLAKDKVDAARAIGADPTLRKEYAADHKDVLAQERAATVAALSERKQDETERRNQANEALRSQQISNVLAAAEIRASRTASKADKNEAMLNLNTTISTQQKLVKEKQDEMRLTKRGSPEEKRLQEEIASANDIIGIASKAVRRKLGDPDDGDNSSPSKAGGSTPAQSGSPKKISSRAEYDKMPSGTVFIDPDGKTRKKP